VSQAHRAKKRFGQNFLTDLEVIDHIVRRIAPKPSDVMVEVGPGLGALTAPLAACLKQLHVVEIDHDVIPRLMALPCASSLVVHLADALEFDFANLFPGDHFRVVGNLPYNISTPLLFHLMQSADRIVDMHFMLQKEVVDRIAASPGNKTYGRLSVVMQYFCQVEKLFMVEAEAFKPKPKVDSAILRLIPKKTRELSVEDEVSFIEIVKQAFSQRRKTLRNTLKTVMTQEMWQQVEFDPSLRAESLSVEQFVALVRVINVKRV
jgi:16S rRNA (adenine1518-N6/adenine1519-N6)-dimethyltransferase